MKARSILGIIALSLALACSSSPPPEAPEDPGAGAVVRNSAALDAIVPEAAKIEKLAGGLQFTEGPVWVVEGGPHLLFSDIPANNIYRWSEGDTEASVFYEGMYRGEPRQGFLGSNGLILDSQGRLVACEHGNRRVSRMIDGEWETLVDNFEGKKLNSPNDAAWHPNGWLYFTDPPYGLAQQEADPLRELDFNGIYRLNYESRELELLVRDQTRPNGSASRPTAIRLMWRIRTLPTRFGWPTTSTTRECSRTAECSSTPERNQIQACRTDSSSTRTAISTPPVPEGSGSSLLTEPTSAVSGRRKFRRTSPGRRWQLAVHDGQDWPVQIKLLAKGPMPANM